MSRFFEGCMPRTLVLSSCLAFAPVVAHADEYTVDTTADTHDANPGDGICADVAGNCSLRAAIEESNADADRDRIVLPFGLYYLKIDQLRIEEDLEIVGAGASSTTIDGNGEHRILEIGFSELLVCDSTNHRVLRYNMRGELLGEFIPPGSGGLSIAGTTLSFGREIYVVGFSSGVGRYDAFTGEFKDLFIPAGTGGLLGPTDIAYGGDFPSSWYVTSFQPGSGIFRFANPTGAFIEEFVPAGLGGLAFPNSIRWRGDLLYVTSAGSGAVLRYDEDGNFVDSFAQGGALDTPRGFVFGGSDLDFDLFVASDGNDRIVRYDGSTGAYLEDFVTAGLGGLDRPTDIAFGPDGNLYVTSRGTQEVLRYDGSTGAFLGVFLPQGAGGLGSPASLEFRIGTGGGPTVNVSGVSLQFGARNSFADSAGGVLVRRGSSLTMRRCFISENEASTFGAGIRNEGVLHLNKCLVQNNRISQGITGGVTATGGGLFNNEFGYARLVRTTFRGNEASRGGGIANNGGLVEMVNCTVVHNLTLDDGGGLRNADSVEREGRMNISFCTISDNQTNVGFAGGMGGGLAVIGGRVQMGNTILAGNTDQRSSFQSEYSPDGYTRDDGEGLALLSQRDNLIGVLNSNLRVVDELTGVEHQDLAGQPGSPLDPMVMQTFENGIVTYALLPGSPAIDAATTVTGLLFDTPSRDQRGVRRPLDGDGDGTGTADIGSYEARH